MPQQALQNQEIHVSSSEYEDNNELEECQYRTVPAEMCMPDPAKKLKKTPAKASTANEASLAGKKRLFEESLSGLNQTAYEDEMKECIEMHKRQNKAVAM